MNYKAIYDRLMERARNRKLEGYSESHHVIPRCMGGTDDRDNLVRLGPEEHFVAHELLVFVYPQHRKLVFALLAMCMNTGGNRPNNKMFGWMRRRSSAAITEMRTGALCSPETREKIRKANTGRVVPADEVERNSASKRGRVFSAEHKKALADAWHKRANKTGMAGKSHSPETKEKMRIAAEARKHTPETIAKLTEFAAKQTPEERSARAHKAWVTKRAKAKP